MKFKDFLNESNSDYRAGDVVEVHSHTKGTDSGKYGTFNIEKVTNTMIYVYDHIAKETIKFNKNSLREIGLNSSLMIVK